MRRVGFIGMGLMGRQITRRLMMAGFPLQVWNRTREKAREILEAGAVWSQTPAACARTADVVITMVTDSAASEEVICGQGGILEGAHPGMILIDMGSIAPSMSRGIAARAKAAGVPMLDAPVTGNPKVASEGKLGIMVGGPRETYDACLPLFEAMGVKIIHVGEENGKGTTLKLINNLVMGVAIEAIAEALVLADKAGIDPVKVIEITSVGGARTGAMETRGMRMIKHDFSPHFSADNMYKDLTSALSLAGEVGACLPAASISREMLRAVRIQGDGAKDSASVITVIERLANTVVTTKG
jgi:3-hydroxyisobutyrate dehydrogenase-like beta-hydroxyacid dehydrogenase